VEDGIVNDFSWSEPNELQGLLEMDLFDSTVVKENLDQFLRREAKLQERKHLLYRLCFMATSCKFDYLITFNAYGTNTNRDVQQVTVLMSWLQTQILFKS